MDINQLTYVNTNEGMSDSRSILYNSCDKMSAVARVLHKTLIGIGVKFDKRIHLAPCIAVICIAWINIGRDFRVIRFILVVVEMIKVVIYYPSNTSLSGISR